MTAVSSPPSVLAEAPAAPAGRGSCRHLPTRRAADADRHAPSVTMPLAFIVTGLLSLLAGSIWLPLRPIILAGYHYGPEVVALTHLLVLGWLGSVVMGATYQLVPVALETRLHQPPLARWHYGLHVAGFLGMVVMFVAMNPKQVGHFGSLLAAGVALFLYNLARTLARIPRWNVVAAGLASALSWLALTVLAGLFVVSAKCWPRINPFPPLSTMHAHAHLGGLGFFLILLLGVSYRLVPMFTLGELQSARRAGWSLALLNAGLAGLFVCLLVGSPWRLACAAVVVAGLALHALEIRAILRARQRRRLDWGMRQFLTALALIWPLAGLGVFLAWPGRPETEFTGQLETVYGLLAFLGTLTLGVLGMLHKVIPFLVWYSRYSKEVGRTAVPALSDLSIPRWQGASYGLLLAGLLVTCVASALGHAQCVRAGSLLWLGGVLAFVLHAGHVLSHLIRPLPAPLVKAS